MFYTYTAALTVAASMLLLVIIFLAYRSRTVILATHIVVMTFLLFVAFQLRDKHQHSRHVRLFLTILASNSLGLICCTIEWVRYTFGNKQPTPATATPNKRD